MDIFSLLKSGDIGFFFLSLCILITVMNFESLRESKMCLNNIYDEFLELILLDNALNESFFL